MGPTIGVNVLLSLPPDADSQNVQNAGKQPMEVAGQKVQLLINMDSGKQFILECDLNDTVGMVKERIQASEMIWADQFVLCIGDNVLSETQASLAEYGLTTDLQVNVVLQNAANNKILLPINIHALDRKFYLECDSNDTIGEVRQMIHAPAKIPVNLQLELYMGTSPLPLLDTLQLHQYGVTAASRPPTLHVLLADEIMLLINLKPVIFTFNLVCGLTDTVGKAKQRICALLNISTQVQLELSMGSVKLLDESMFSDYQVTIGDLPEEVTMVVTNWNSDFPHADMLQLKRNIIEFKWTY